MECASRSWVPHIYTADFLIDPLSNLSDGLRVISLTQYNVVKICVFESCPPKSCVVQESHGDDEGQSAEGTTDSDPSLRSYT